MEATAAKVDNRANYISIKECKSEDMDKAYARVQFSVFHFMDTLVSWSVF
jgi:hypothetical protein